MMLCHGVELGVLAGKLCVRDAQMSNAVYVPTPPYVMGLSQASWQGSCASGTHRCPTLSTFPRHHATSSRHIFSPYIVMLYLILLGYLHLDYYNVFCNSILHTPHTDSWNHRSSL